MRKWLHNSSPWVRLSTLQQMVASSQGRPAGREVHNPHTFTQPAHLTIAPIYRRAHAHRHHVDVSHVVAGGLVLAGVCRPSDLPVLNGHRGGRACMTLFCSTDTDPSSQCLQGLRPCARTDNPCSHLWVRCCLNMLPYACSGIATEPLF